jgi:hypothetical protein
MGRVVPLPPRVRDQERLRRHVVSQTLAEPPCGIAMDVAVMAIEHDREILRLPYGQRDDRGIAVLHGALVGHRGHICIGMIIVCLSAL